jgi:protein-S-isoprenylcysteine O-methyltransferase Ste14
LAGYLAQQGMKIVFGEERAAPAVIEKGVFGLVRHPIYLGCILFYAGLVMFTFSLSAAVICIAIMAFYHYIAKYEERILLTRFGKKYVEYTESVPMWIPRL